MRSWTAVRAVRDLTARGTEPSPPSLLFSDRSGIRKGRLQVDETHYVKLRPMAPRASMPILGTSCGVIPANAPTQNVNVHHAARSYYLYRIPGMWLTGCQCFDVVCQNAH